MISFFREWALGVCCASLFGAIIYAISPGGTMKKSVKTVVAIVIICVVIFPFTKGGFEINWDFQDSSVSDSVYSSELESAVEYQLTAAYADEIERKADDILSAFGIADSEITLMTDINEQGSIFIKKAYIETTDNLQPIDAETQKELYELFGEETIIVFN